MPFAAEADADSACAGMAEDDAERMTDRIGKDPEARLTPTSDTSSSQSQQFLLCPVGIAHPNIEMQLLRIGGVRPARGNPFGDPLKSQLPQARPRADNYPAVDVFVDPHPQYLAVELGESPRVGAVDHCLFQVADHTDSISAPAATPPDCRQDRHAQPRTRSGR